MKTVRKLFQVLCILVLVTTLTNCQNDTVTETLQEEALQKEFPFKSSVLSKQDVETNTKLSNQMRSLATLQSSSLAESVYNETYNFTVHTDVASFVESTENDSHSYTFPISRENNTGSALENLVFSYDALTDDYEASLVTYHFTASQQQEFMLTQHVATPHTITYESIAVNLSDIVGESPISLPCTAIYTVYHITPDTGETFVYGADSTCQHENDDDPCDTYTVIEINCPNGGGTANGSSTPNPYSSPNNTPTGGGNNTGSGTPPPPNTDDYNDIVTSPISKDELQEITSQLNEIFGEGNWEASDDLPEDAPNFDTIEELQAYLDRIVSENLNLESSQTLNEENGIREDIYRIKINDTPSMYMKVVTRVQLPTTNNGLQRMRVISMDSHLEETYIIFDWLQTTDTDVSNIATGPIVDYYPSGTNGGRLKVSVNGQLILGFKLGGYPVGAVQHLKMILNYNLSNNQPIPDDCYWQYF